jgi:GNAT superfamily N-acetyltransferase
VVSGAPKGSLDLDEWQIGNLLPGDWFRVEADGAVVGYGWLDAVWGDAEIHLVVDPQAQNLGAGSFILDQLADAARSRGLLYLFNAIPFNHPDPEKIRAWLGARGFVPDEDGRILRRMVGTE